MERRYKVGQIKLGNGFVKSPQFPVIRTSSKKYENVSKTNEVEDLVSFRKVSDSSQMKYKKAIANANSLAWPKGE